LCSDMAPYVLTGMLTRPKLMAPFQIVRGGRTLTLLYEGRVLRIVPK